MDGALGEPSLFPPTQDMYAVPEQSEVAYSVPAGDRVVGLKWPLWYIQT